MRQGRHIFSPISHTHPIALAGSLPLGWDFWQAYDRAILRVCKRVIVLMLKGWKESKGVAGEIAIAEELGLPIVYMSMEDIYKAIVGEVSNVLSEETRARLDAIMRDHYPEPKPEGIPTTLTEAVDRLMATLTPEDKQELDAWLYRRVVIPETASAVLAPLHHFNFGMNLRNKWDLWGDSPLAQWFVTNLRLGHADDMSGVITEAFLARYQNKPFDSSPLVERYREHWKKYYPNAEDPLEAIIAEREENLRKTEPCAVC